MSLAGTVYQQQYIAQKSEIEYKIMSINQAKLSLTTSMDDLLNVGTDLEPDNPVVKQLEARKERLHQLEKKLDMQLALYQKQLQQINENMGSIK